MSHPQEGCLKAEVSPTPLSVLSRILGASNLSSHAPLGLPRVLSEHPAVCISSTRKSAHRLQVETGPWVSLPSSERWWGFLPLSQRSGPHHCGLLSKVVSAGTLPRVPLWVPPRFPLLTPGTVSAAVLGS